MFNIDVHMFAAVFGIAVAGGVIGLDRTAAGQFMISQPIVAAPLAGLILGDGATGLLIGAVLELVWVLDMPVGTFVPADATLGAVSATAIAVLSGPSLDVVGFSLVFTTLTVPVTMMLDRFVRSRNSRLAEAAFVLEGPDAGAGLAKTHLSGLFLFFLKSFVLYLVFIPAGFGAAALFHAAPQPLHAGMALFVKILPLLGAGVVFGKLSRSPADRSFFLGFGAALVLSGLLHVNPMLVMLLIGGAVLVKSMRRSSRQ